MLTDSDIAALDDSQVRIPGSLVREIHRSVREHHPTTYEQETTDGQGPGTSGLVRWVLRDWCRGKRESS